MTHAPTTNLLDRILCVFCSAPWTPENIKTYYIDSGMCVGSSADMDSEFVTVEIACHSCGKVMYRKDGQRIE